jgi:hypothetical protein
MIYSFILDCRKKLLLSLFSIFKKKQGHQGDIRGGKGQKAFTAIGLIKATETLRKNSHITLKNPPFHYKCI